MDHGQESQCLARDTAVYALARVSEALLRAAFRDSRVRERYRLWQRSLRSSTTAAGASTRSGSQPLVHCASQCGSAVVLAMGESDEFLVLYEHAGFEAVMAVRLDRLRGELQDLWLATFVGSHPQATRFARVLTDALHTRATVPRLCALPSPAPLLH